jgi:PEP-CTERM motif
MAFPKIRILSYLLLPAAAFAGIPYTIGDVFASIGTGRVNEYTPGGVLVQTLNTGNGAAFTTGSGFDSSGNFFVTDFGSNVVSKFDNSGNLINGSFLTGFSTDPESVSFASNGNIFIGQADGTHQIREYTSAGAFVAAFSADVTGQRGTDWIDLASNQTTLYYAGEGTSIRRYDTVGGQLTAFATGLPGQNAFELRILSNGDVLVADKSQVVELDGTGAILKQYTTANTFAGKTIGELFSLNIDPDGTTFWTGDDNNGTIYHVNIATGALLGSFTTCGGDCLFGVSVFGEQVVGNPPDVPEPGSVFLLGTVALGIVGLMRKKLA